MNISAITCPVCGERLPITTDTMEAWGSPVTCEESAECPAGHYTYEFAYGAYRETIGTEEFTWSYRETAEQTEAREAAVERAKTALCAR